MGYGTSGFSLRGPPTTSACAPLEGSLLPPPPLPLSRRAAGRVARLTPHTLRLHARARKRSNALPVVTHAWLAEHFTKAAAKCEVNVGGVDDKKAPNQHGAQQYKMINGEMLTQLAAM